MPNHCENDLYITGPEADVSAVLEFIGINETPAVFDFKRLIPYPEPFASMDAEYRAIEEAGRAAGMAAIGAWPKLDDPEFDKKRAVYRQADREVTAPLMDAYKAKWGTDKDGYNVGGYEWCCNAWGTKWGAYDVARRDYDGRVCVTFQTAWSPPSDAIFEALAQRFPTCSFTLEYFERGMGFCGGAEWPAEDDWYEDEPWASGTKRGAWESREYCGVRGG